ncbi:DnaJ domain-containing protein [Clostridium saccharobutylicum]|uniref:Chaperone protein DnaJ n=1 Tax=Clostridium saccharobutylicum TaxID=169679 RepID=A0A1S8N1M6_CLOSA|nr:DnaJ domain-containing protein [Clostridium saccharobutylicum]OOM10419.1 chaperone protein DnaJ [Clostridium saccharobutylicum]
MTDYYKLLGVEENASKEEIREAYEKQVEKIKKEVVNEKRLNQFLKIFDEAYEALNNLEENKLKDQNATLIRNPQEVERELEDDNSSNNYLNTNNSKRKRRSANRKKDDFIEKGSSKNKDKKNKLNDKREEKGRKQKAVKKKTKSNINTVLQLIMLPIKIILLPIIAILSVIILLLQIINIISWIVTKVLIVGSISLGAIHLYQVKLGQPMNYNILILSSSVLVASFFLPYILKFVLKVLKSLNDILKGIVF